MSYGIVLSCLDEVPDFKLAGAGLKFNNWVPGIRVGSGMLATGAWNIQSCEFVLEPWMLERRGSGLCNLRFCLRVRKAWVKKACRRRAREMGWETQTLTMCKQQV